MPDFNELPRPSIPVTLWSQQNVVNIVETRILDMTGATKLIINLHVSPQVNALPNEILTDSELTYTYNAHFSPSGCGSGHSVLEDGSNDPYIDRVDTADYERGYDFHDTDIKQISSTIPNTDGQAQIHGAVTYWNCSCPADAGTDGARRSWSGYKNQTSTYDVEGYDDSGFSTGQEIYGTAMNYSTMTALFPVSTSKRYILITQHQVVTHTFTDVSTGQDNNCGCCNGPFGPVSASPAMARFVPSQFEDDFRQNATASFKIEIKDSNGVWHDLVPNSQLGGAVGVSQDQVFEIGLGAPLNHILPSDAESLRVELNAFGNVPVSFNIQKVF